MERLYADDLVLVAETEELLLGKLRKWKKGMEMKSSLEWTTGNQRSWDVSWRAAQ